MNWNATKEDGDLIALIAKQAAQHSPRVKVHMVMMDLTVTHLNGCPLDLESMADAADDTSVLMSDVMHDVHGIAQHLDRETGKLGDFFTPRFAAKYSATERRGN